MRYAVMTRDPPCANLAACTIPAPPHRFGPAGLRPDLARICGQRGLRHAPKRPTGLDPATLSALVSTCSSRGLVSFQITILKVLAGHPGGRLSVADLTRCVSILISSGSDWTNRTKPLAARAPALDIFSQSFVLRDSAG